MKKTYSKPDILFDSFSLCTSVAAGCEYETNFSEGTCGYRFGPLNIFLETVDDACTTETNDGSEDFNGICYHVPIDTKNVFNS